MKDENQYKFSLKNRFIIYSNYKKRLMKLSNKNKEIVHVYHTLNDCS